MTGYDYLKKNQLYKSIIKFPANDKHTTLNFWNTIIGVYKRKNELRKNKINWQLSFKYSWENIIIKSPSNCH